MKKSKVLAAAMASIVLTGGLSSCSFCADENVEPDVYGPPESYDESVEESGSEGKPEEEFDPEINIEPAVYGPPGAF